MLSQDVREQIQKAYSQFLKQNELTARPSQKLMIASIAKTLSTNLSTKGEKDNEQQTKPPICAIEAGTGTGKTLAYLIAALPIAMAEGKTLIVSTATINLQQQLIHKDLPEIRASTDIGLNYQLIKGRGRYLCNAKLEQFLQGGAQHEIIFEDGNVRTFTADALQLYREFETAISDDIWDGDRDQWHEVIDSEHWWPLTSDRHQCAGRNCPYVNKCAFFRARDAMEETHCLVANHDIVLSDLSLGGGAILPKPEDCIYIFDEAHHLANKTRNHFSSRCRLQSSLNQLSQMEKQLIKLESDLPKLQAISSVIEARNHLNFIMDQLHTLNTDSIRYFEQNAKEYSHVIRFTKGDLPDFIMHACEELVPLYKHLIACINTVHQQLQPDTDTNSNHRPLYEHWYAILGQHLGYIEGQAKLWFNYHNADSQSLSFARWIRYYEQDNDIECLASPILPADNLYETLWSKCSGAVLTSATLTALGSFDQLIMLSGIPSDANFQRLASPFDYQSNTLLQLSQRGDPRDSTAHTQYIIEQLPTLLDKNQGSLVLFSSERQMNEVYDGMPKAWKKVILLQGTYSRQAIIEHHCNAIDKQQGSTIFGLASFAEGVDLPGDYCKHVVIAKIPFSSPDNPIDEALAEWVEEQGQNSFFKISLPNASLRLIQATGRLIRSEKDSGVITIFDQRLVTKNYGKQLLDALPPFKREVIDFG